MTVQSFDSFEDMMAEIEKAREAADSRIRSEQASLSPGDHFMIPEPDGTIIFGEVLDPVEYVDPEEVEDLRDFYTQNHMRGYRFSRCFSIYCPHGEMGDIHVAMVTPISAGVFEAARVTGWNLRA